MKKKDIFLLAVLLIATVASMRVSAQTVDPNMTEFGGYGYLLSTSNAADLWWTEAALSQTGSKAISKDSRKAHRNMTSCSHLTSLLCTMDSKDSA